MAVAAGASGIGQIQRQALGLGVRWTEGVDDGKGKRRSRHHHTDLQIPSCSGWLCAREASMVSHSFVRLTEEVQEQKPPSLSCTAPSFPRSSRRWRSSSAKCSTRKASAVMSTIIVPVWMRGGKRGGWASPSRAASMSGPPSAQEDRDQAKEDQQGIGPLVDGRNLPSPLSDDNEEGKEGKEDQGMEPADGTNLSSAGPASISSSSVPPSSPPPPLTSSSPPAPPLTSSSPPPPPRASSSPPPPPPPPPPDSPVMKETSPDDLGTYAAAVLDNPSPHVDESSLSAASSSPSPPPLATPSPVLSIATDTESETESDTEFNTESDMDVVAAAAVLDDATAVADGVAAVVDSGSPGLDSDADSTNGSYVQQANDLVGKSDDDSDERVAAACETSTAEEAEVSEGVRTSVDVMAGAHYDTDTDSSATATPSGKRLSAFQPSAGTSGRNERNTSSVFGASAGRRAKRGKNISDYIRIVSEYLKYEKGPPRWFAPIDAEPQRADAPLVLFLPGIEGTGFSLLLQHESLKRYFELWCLSIPPSDRTPFRELVDLVRTTVESEHKRNPQRAVYLLGESFGGCLALAAASELKGVYLHLILINPATSFESSPLKPLFPLMGTLPDNIFPTLPYVLWPAFGDPLRLATAGFEGSLQPWDRMWNIRDRLVQMLPELGELSNLLPKESLLWKLQLLKEGAAFANSRLGDIEAPALILASGKDNVLPSTEEATRLKAALNKRVRIRSFEDGGHCLLLEEVLNLGVLVRATGMYRRTKKDEDEVECFVPPTDDEVKTVRTGFFSFMRQVASPVFLSTNRKTGEVEFGLHNIPEDRPLLLIGNHQIMGSELFLLTEELWCEANIMVRGLAHPLTGFEPSEGNVVPVGDLFRLFGAVPSTGTNLYKLLARKEVALLYPGGAREAFKRRGERNMVLWPEQPEFVRMAIRHGATILPFAGIGGDDAFEFVLDTDEMAKLPFLGENMARDAQKIQAVRKVQGDDLFLPPIIVPKIGTRMYYFFRKPIPTKGLYEAGALSDRELVRDMYLKVKSEVQGGIDFLLEKREQDPYDNFLTRLAYESIMPGSKAPAFRL